MAQPKVIRDYTRFVKGGSFLLRPSFFFFFFLLFFFFLFTTFFFRPFVRNYFPFFFRVNISHRWRVFIYLLGEFHLSYISAFIRPFFLRAHNDSGPGPSTANNSALLLRFSHSRRFKSKIRARKRPLLSTRYRRTVIINSLPPLPTATRRDATPLNATVAPTSRGVRRHRKTLPFRARPSRLQLRLNSHARSRRPRKSIAANGTGRDGTLRAPFEIDAASRAEHRRDGKATRAYHRALPTKLAKATRGRCGWPLSKTERTRHRGNGASLSPCDQNSEAGCSRRFGRGEARRVDERDDGRVENAVSPFIRPSRNAQKDGPVSGAADSRGLGTSPRAAQTAGDETKSKRGTRAAAEERPSDTDTYLLRALAWHTPHRTYPALRGPPHKFHPRPPLFCFSLSRLVAFALSPRTPSF